VTAATGRGAAWLAAFALACAREPCRADCELFGRCTPHGERCVATSSADCGRSHDCRDYGRCTVADGMCRVGSANDCRRGAPCRLDGRCAPGPKDRCVAIADADCRASEACRARGLCRADRGACVAAPR